MANLSLLEDGGRAVGVASPVFFTSPSPLSFNSRAEVTFEVLEQDAEALKALLGRPHCYVLGSEYEPFWATLNSLSPCESTAPGLALLKHKVTLRGAFSVIEEASAKQ